MQKRIYAFGGGRPLEPLDGGGRWGDPGEGVLGPHGAMMAELCRLRAPVRPGFCIGAALVSSFTEPDDLLEAVAPAVQKLQRVTSRGWVMQHRPLLLCAQAGDARRGGGEARPARVCYLGLNDEVVEAQATLEGAHFAWDSYRELIVSYSRVVHGLDMSPFERELEETLDRLDAKCQLGRKHSACDIPASELRLLVAAYKGIYAEQTGEDFPQDPDILLLDTLRALCGEEASGRAVVVQAMAFGNYDATSGSGCVTLRKPGTGATDDMRGAWLPRASCARSAATGDRAGEQRALTEAESRRWAAERSVLEAERLAAHPSLQEALPSAFRELSEARALLEERFSDALAKGPAWQLEFTVQQGKLWVLSCGPDENHPLVQQRPSAPGARGQAEQSAAGGRDDCSPSQRPSSKQLAPLGPVRPQSKELLPSAGPRPQTPTLVLASASSSPTASGAAETPLAPALRLRAVSTDVPTRFASKDRAPASKERVPMPTASVRSEVALLPAMDGDSWSRQFSRDSQESKDFCIHLPALPDRKLCASAILPARPCLLDSGRRSTKRVRSKVSFVEQVEFCPREAR